ncbi:50S ribosomal protein L10 [Candidatus Profftella armatura (Diaphorina cf. continua)]|uniref:Large ribosomal subunit protein uL10 n=1 Tax=Candidatus Profftella armatura (Diaphorina cf. continua) TaxID=2661583 RepID=A0A7R7AC57_9PROT|nr:50S ribosomal protein L10 [Candidatus Profftella armatura (Diaphorina cf. continua)]BCG49440.1 50S ribosomal protein L10 [Candidatus Profftella armatura (Diaphorina cf. continua)]
MSPDLNDKKSIIKEVSDQVANSQIIILSEYSGIKVNQLTKLREKARKKNLYLRVLKNTLARRIFKNTIFSNLSSELYGQLIYLISNDIIKSAKVINDFSKNNEKLTIRIGNFSGNLLDKKTIIKLANIPTKKVLLTQLLKIIFFPISSFIYGLSIVSKKK